MKMSKYAVILSAAVVLMTAVLWVILPSKTQGILSGTALKRTLTAVSAPIVVQHADDLLLVEFFAGY